MPVSLDWDLHTSKENLPEVGHDNKTENQKQSVWSWRVVQYYNLKKF